MTRHPQYTRHTPKKDAPGGGAAASSTAADPQIAPVTGPSFAQPTFTPDPNKFHVRHLSDTQAYKEIDKLNAEHKLETLPFPAPRGLPEPVLTLQEVLGGSKQAIAAIQAAGQIVFHALGDTGSTRGPATESLVADKLVSDFHEANAAGVPSFFFHLGDVVYSFGEARYYYDQFYDTYRDYPAPILALAGNHDGMVAPGVDTPSLDAFLRNFCQESFVITPEAGGLNRTAQIQPGVFFTFEAPFVRILSLYSGTLEDPGIIANDAIGTTQLDYLSAALKRAKAENKPGALIIAHHHPAYAGGGKHGGSPDMLAQIDKICAAERIWPHAVLSGHAHNYQRFTRAHQKMQIPYVTAGNGGHGLMTLVGRSQPVPRVPMTLPGDNSVTFESYDDQDYGYLRIIADARTLRIEYHPASDGPSAKTPDDVVTVDLATHTAS